MKGYVIKYSVPQGKPKWWGSTHTCESLFDGTPTQEEALQLTTAFGYELAVVREMTEEEIRAYLKQAQRTCNAVERAERLGNTKTGMKTVL